MKKSRQFGKTPEEVHAKLVTAAEDLQAHLDVKHPGLFTVSLKADGLKVKKIRKP